MNLEQRRLSFGSIASLYHHVRPDYPHQAIQWALAPLGPGSHNIADLGSGTGILTRGLLAAGHTVVAVEPDADMRAQFTLVTPGIPPLDGSAEEIPLPNGSMSAVVAGQAYHWFNPDKAHKEVARVLRPDGVFAAIWNDWDTSVGWVAEVDEIIDGPVQPKLRLRGGVDFGEEFAPQVTATFAHDRLETPNSLRELVESRSVFIAAPQQRQETIRTAIDNLCARHPDLRNRREFGLRYVTTVVRATVRSK